jgi:hypothetical protein
MFYFLCKIGSWTQNLKTVGSNPTRKKNYLPKQIKDWPNILTWPFIGKLLRRTFWWYHWSFDSIEPQHLFYENPLEKYANLRWIIAWGIVCRIYLVDLTCYKLLTRPKCSYYSVVTWIRITARLPAGDGSAGISLAGFISDVLLAVYLWRLLWKDQKVTRSKTVVWNQVMNEMSRDIVLTWLHKCETHYVECRSYRLKVISSGNVC